MRAEGARAAAVAGPRPLSPAAAHGVLAGLFALYFAGLALPRVQATAHLFGAWLGAGLLTVGALLWARRRGRRRGGAVGVTFVPRRPHFVQIFVQGSVYAYWGLYAEAVYPQIPLILGQALLGMLFDVGIGWWRHGNARLSLGAWPIVGSINLFLWFDDAVYGWQLAVLVGAFASRELLQWRRDGVRTHIFNPSALPLTVAALVLIAFGWVHHSSAAEISSTLGLGPLSFEQIFAAALVGQLFFGVTLVPMSAALTMVGLDHLWLAATGGWFFLDAAIPIAVFLSMNLLITDPVTSPRTATGKVLFGALYGVGVMALYLGLRALEVIPTDTDPGLEAAFFDKLLHVPLLNLLVIGLDRVGTRLPLEGLWGARPGPPGAPGTATGLRGLPLRALHVSIWIGAFWLIRPQLVAYPGASSQFWREACARGSARDACDNLLRVLAGPCSQGELAMCHDLALYYDAGLGPPPAGQTAAAVTEGLLGRNCDRGLAVSCVLLGERLMARGEAPSRARGAFAQACAAGHAPGCTRLGIAQIQGGVGPDDRAQGRARLQEGCDRGDGLGCDLAAGEAMGALPPDPARALAGFARACALGHDPGCVHQAELLRVGFGTPRDPLQAAALLGGACTRGEGEACAQLAEMHSRGEGVPADAARAGELRKRACERGFLASCRP